MKPKLAEMTLREKIGQTGMPAPSEVNRTVSELGSYEAYFEKYPFCGLYLGKGAVRGDGERFSSPAELGAAMHKATCQAKIPLLISADCEYGANSLFPTLHAQSTNMAIGAADDGELAYKRAYYWAKELRSCGVNWPFGPVVDLHTNFFSPGGIRRMSSEYQTVAKLAPYIIKGMHDAGVGSSAKHYPGASKDYRDSHFCFNVNTTSLEQWYSREFKIWKAAVNAGVMSLMTGHSAVPAMDDSFARADIPRPASASKKVMDIARKELNFDGVLITDAVNMKGLAAAFEHEDIYIECFNAGHDIILFCHNDYIDVMEKAVLDGRVSEKQIDEACARVLEMKEKLGLFDEICAPIPLTEAEQKDLEQVNYRIGVKALTLINNKGNIVPFAKEKIKKVAIIGLSPDELFMNCLQDMIQAFEEKGIEVTFVDRIRTKAMLKEFSETHDLIVYACFLAQSRPIGMSFYSRPQEMGSLFHSLSYGATKSVVVSFGAPSIYYNYFENADAYINAYSPDPGMMRAFVDGVLGEFEFTAKSPIPLRPEFKDM